MIEQEKVKKAIKMLQDWNKDLDLMEDEEGGIECHELAIEALKKQKPAKPFENLSIFGGIEYDCRWCGNEVKRINAFCPWCGQKQDWGEEE